MHGKLIRLVLMLVVMTALAIEAFRMMRKVRKQIARMGPAMDRLSASPGLQQARVMQLELERLEEVARQSAHVDGDYRLRSLMATAGGRPLGCFLSVTMAAVLIIAASGPLVRLEKATKMTGTLTSVVMLVTMVVIFGFTILVSNRIFRWWGINPLESGLSLYIRRNLGGAAKRFRKAVARRPKSLRANYALACVLLEMGQVDQATEAAEQLRMIYSDCMFTHEVQGRIEVLRGSDSAARNEFRLAADAADRVGALTIAKAMRELSENPPGEIAAKVSPFLLSFSLGQGL
jgi:hypothetical protein